MPNPVLGPPGSATPTNASSAVQLPNIPTATDLASALSALSAVTAAINILANAIPASAGGTATGSSTTTSTFQLVDQQTQTVTVSDPNDATVFVQVNQVVSLTFFNPVTKETLAWTL
jgi:hypothetical protein